MRFIVTQFSIQVRTADDRHCSPGKYYPSHITVKGCKTYACNGLLGQTPQAAKALAHAVAYFENN